MASIRIGGMVSGMDTDAMVKQLMEAKSSKVKLFNQKKTKSEWKQEAYQSLNKDMANFIVDARKKLGLTNYTYTGKLYAGSIDKVDWGKKAETTGSAFTAKASAGAPDISLDVKVNELASSASITGKASEVKSSDKVGQDTTLKLKVNKEVKTIELKADMSIADAVKKIKADTGLNVSFGKVGNDTSMLFMSTKESGADKSIKFEDEATNKFFEKLGVDSSVLTEGVKGSNSVIEVNGVKVENSSNEVSINGINLSLKEKTGATAQKVSVKTDTDAIFDKIKTFVEDYNKIMTSMQAKRNEVVHRKYQPLSKEERKALSEEEVKLWDEKAKSGLLKDDAALGNTISNIRSGLYEKVEGAGSMHEIGITTGNWKTGAVLQIDEKKLKEAIGKDPQKVLDTLFKSPEDIGTHAKNSPEGKAQRANTGVFVRIMDDMANGINAIAKESGAGNESSILQQVRGNILSGIIKNSSVLEKDILNINKRIDDETRKLSIYETSLYAKFSKMETAIQNMQKQGSVFMQQGF